MKINQGAYFSLCIEFYIRSNYCYKKTILNFKNSSEISAASGVVLDSSAKREFNENYIKAKSLLELFK